MINTIKSTKIDPNESLHSCAVSNEILNENSNFHCLDDEILNNRDSDGMRDTQQTDHLKTLIATCVERSVQRGEEIDSNKIIFEKYPGFIHVAIDSLEKLNLDAETSVSVQISAENVHSLTQKHYPSDFIKLNHYFRVPVLNQNHTITVLKLKIIGYNGPSRRCLYDSILEITTADIAELHNRLVEHRLEFSEAQSLVKKIFNFKQIQSKSEMPVCRCYLSYLSNNEFKDALSIPENLLSLSKWVIFRKPAFEMLFRGSVAMKYDKNGSTWEKRYIIWLGYLIFVFDSQMKNLLQVTDLSDAEPSLEMIPNRIIIFRIGTYLCHIEFETEDTLKRCTEGTYRLFPKIIEWI